MSEEILKVPKKDLSLTELAEINSMLTAELEAHTKARNYLWQVINQEEALPIMQLSPLPTSGELLNEEARQASAVIDMRQLPQELSDTILYIVLEHEEKLAFSTWQELANNSSTAAKVIDKLKQQRAKDAQEDEEFNQILPMTAGQET